MEFKSTSTRKEMLQANEERIQIPKEIAEIDKKIVDKQMHDNGMMSRRKRELEKRLDNVKARKAELAVS